MVGGSGVETWPRIVLMRQTLLKDPLAAGSLQCSWTGQFSYLIATESCCNLSSTKSQTETMPPTCQGQSQDVA